MVNAQERTQLFGLLNSKPVELMTMPLLQKNILNCPDKLYLVSMDIASQQQKNEDILQSLYHALNRIIDSSIAG